MPKTCLVHFNHIERNGLVGWPDMNTSSWKPNYGDMLVCSAIINQTNSQRSPRINFGETLNSAVDYAIIRGSTYLHNKFNFADAIKTIDSIDADIICIGLGAQNPDFDLTYLDNNKEASIFIAKLNEKSKSISVRGDFTAAIVERLGGKGIRVTGCPSFFYFNKQNPIRLGELLLTKERRVGFSIHSGLNQNIFCRDPVLTFKRHGQLFDYFTSNAQRINIFEQGNSLEFLISNRYAPFEVRKAAAASLIKQFQLNTFSEEMLIGAFSSVLSIEEWLAKARDVDAAFGFRFHGNMVMLNQGIPAYFYVYDSRLQEFCNLYHLPHQNVEDDFGDPLRSLLDHDWDRTNQAILTCRNELQNFYNENGVEWHLEA